MNQLTYKKPSVKPVRLYHWTYDDGSVQYALKGKTGKLTPKYGAFPDKQHFREQKKSIKKSLGSSYELMSKSLKIPCGLGPYCKDNEKYFLLDNAKRGFAEFQKLLDCCGEAPEARHEVMQLVSGILVGYCARIFYENDDTDVFPLLSQRAPIIRVSGDDKTFDVLAQMACALTVDTSASGKKLQLENPRVLPPQTAVFSIDQCAYLTFREKYYCPTQYRDTAVLLHGFFFKKGDILRFAKRNPWASLLLFNCGACDCGAVTLSTDAKILNTANLSWNWKLINDLVGHFLRTLSYYEHNPEVFADFLLSQWQQVESALYHYALHSKDRPGPSRLSMAKLQLLVLRLFACFCVRKNIVTAEEGNELIACWSNWLFPGSGQNAESADNVPMPQSPEEVFRDLLSRMISPDHMERFLFVGASRLFDRYDPDHPDFRYWGYCNHYKERKGNREEFHALLIRKHDFEDIAAELGTDRTVNVKDLFSALFKENIGFLHAKKARFSKGTASSKSEDGYVLNIDKMGFLTEEQRDLLLARFES